jgi:hypothetical protein
MIFKRAIAKLRAQEWGAITIELMIVIVGVFVGTLVANWNQDRVSKAETRRMIAQLDPTLRQLTDYFLFARTYYATTRAYSDTAIAGWRGNPGVNDANFVIAAYQASQIFTLGINGSTWSTILGTDRIRDIDDPTLRTDLAVLMTADYSQFDQAGVNTPYRHNVRRIIPVEIQDAIRARCGDRQQPGNLSILTLPPTCKIAIPPAAAAKAAAALRAHPELLEDLQGHIAAIAAFRDNIIPVETAARRIEAKSP